MLKERQERLTRRQVRKAAKAFLRSKKKRVVKILDLSSAEAVGKLVGSQSAPVHRQADRKAMANSFSELYARYLLIMNDPNRKALARSYADIANIKWTSRMSEPNLFVRMLVGDNDQDQEKRNRMRSIWSLYGRALEHCRKSDMLAEVVLASGHGVRFWANADASLLSKIKSATQPHMFRLRHDEMPAPPRGFVVVLVQTIDREGRYKFIAAKTVGLNLAVAKQAWRKLKCD